MNKISSSSKLLLNIINDILDMSAIENQKLKITSTTFDFKDLLLNISNLYYTQCKDKGINFELLINDVTDEILVGDPLRVNQILLNLLSNAYKFTQDGGEIRVVVEQTLVKDDDVFMRFKVSDTGCGMSEEMLKKIFMPFEQESADTARKYGGSGLGMSITKNLVDLMHGTIIVNSEIDKGTCFTLDMPFKKVGSEKIIGDSQRIIKDIKALIVEDDFDTMEYTSQVLNRIGVEHDKASGGQEAINKIIVEHDKGLGYDVCFIDWKMPTVNGIEVVRKIRELYNEDTLIIIVSAYDLSEVEEEALNAGANLFVAKPLFQSTVFNLLMNLSGGKYKALSAIDTEFDFTGHRLLLVEDNELNREIATELLELVNMSVDIAFNGKEAVDKFVNCKPGTYDVILMDVQMPILDGYGATKQIRDSKHPDGKNIPIYAMTANAFVEDVSASISCGMNGHISKPIDTQILYTTLKNELEKEN